MDSVNVLDTLALLVVHSHLATAPNNHRPLHQNAERWRHGIRVRERAMALESAWSVQADSVHVGDAERVWRITALRA
jgi:hypothetical protein